MVDNYRSNIREVVQQHIEKGYQVQSIPFTPEDKLMAKYILKDLPVYHDNYSDNSIKMLKIMGSAEKIKATRYHASIFALKVGAETMFIAYALKNERMLSELGINQNQFTTAGELANGKIFKKEFFKIDDHVIEKWENECFDFINDFIQKNLTK